MKGIRFPQDSRFQRRMVLIFSCLLLSAVVAVAVVWIIEVLSSSAHGFSDRLAEATVIIAGATLLLAFIAALLALLAYAVATGLPNLELQVRFEFSELNKPVFRAHVAENSWLEAERFKQTMGTISLRNINGYSARNPAVVVRLIGMAFTTGDQVPSTEWVIIDFANTIGIKAVQWDGGPTFSIHGHSVRRLPVLDLVRLQQIPPWGKPALAFELLADGGYRREITVPVDFAVDQQSQFPSQGSTEVPGWL